ncbi:hypothetical protein ETI06_08795 [Macrococcoides goetzii]|nr:hypothetical protein [Macrococcus goetzii]TDM42436.1 hypothetical protein ETI10_04870 [Macrococcus goetzii]TDM47579.1 hypothetical protein ETI08_00150 [Macrococcus goetzii]TDM49114.1 hypothetical protein ETI06_08795 [Macrococcus goetzii]
MVGYNSNIVNLMTKIHEYKGKQIIYLQYNTATLEKLKFSGLYHNVKYGCALSGYSVSDTKLLQILQFKKSFNNEIEAQICGFRDALLYIVEDYEFIDINYESICAMYLEMSMGDEESISKSSEVQRDAIKQLCLHYNNVIDLPHTNIMIEIFQFVFEFIQSNLFANKTLLFSRLLLNLLLYKSNILVTQYQSIEKLIYEDIAGNNKRLKKKNVDYFPFEDIQGFMNYYFYKILESYESLDYNFQLILNEKITPQYRVLNVLNRSFEPIARKDLEIMLADISRKTIERALVQLQKEDFIVKVGQGKSTQYKVK